MRNLLKRGLNKSQRLFADFLFDVKLESIYLLKKNGAKIICYHGVDLYENKHFNMRFFSIKSIEKHFYYINKYFNPVSVKDYFEGNFDNSKFNVAITFDDGYRNNFKYLIPLAEKYNIPVSIYVTGVNETKYNFLWSDFTDIVSFYSDKNQFELDGLLFIRKGNTFFNDNDISIKKYIKQKGDFLTKVMFINNFPEFGEICEKYPIDDYWQLMSDEEIIRASKSKIITIGSHAFYHNNFDNIPIDDAVNEMLLSKQYLEKLIQKPIEEIAYPDGAYTRDVVEEAAKIGFKRQLAVTYKHDDDMIDNRILDRHGMYPVYSNNYQILQIVK